MKITINGKAYIPNSRRAICDAKIATVHHGQRVVKKYTSGEMLVGKIQEHDAPPFTGYVRGWFKNKRKRSNVF